MNASICGLQRRDKSSVGPRGARAEAAAGGALAPKFTAWAAPGKTLAAARLAQINAVVRCLGIGSPTQRAPVPDVRREKGVDG
jgi:hypothetical protein